MRNRVIVGDILDMAATLPAGSVQTIATSPPYWGLRKYEVPPTDWPAVEYAPMPGLPPVAVPAQTVCLGQEKSPLDFVGHLVLVFRALRHALREDGTLWCNLGDGYAEKNLVGIPWRAAFALQADGWILRSEVIWHKVAPMPESVTDRPTKAHEQIFLFSKRASYFYDAESIREAQSEGTFARFGNGGAPRKTTAKALASTTGVERANASFKDATPDAILANGRNKRTVWSPPPAQFPGAHFSTWPPELVRPMVRAGSSDFGCCEKCSAPYRRETVREFQPLTDRTAAKLAKGSGTKGMDTSNRWGETPRGTTATQTTGWERTCRCEGAGVRPCLCLDPFMGSGTTAAVCVEEGRDWLGIDADPRAVTWTAERVAAIPVGRLDSAEGATRASAAQLPLLAAGG